MKYNDDDYRNEANWPHPDPERETWVDSLAWAAVWLWLATMAVLTIWFGYRWLA